MAGLISGLTGWAELANTILGSKLGQGGLTYLGSQQQSKAEEAARQATLQRYNDALAMLRTMRGNVMGTQANQAASEQEMLGGIRSNLMNSAQGNRSAILDMLRGQNADVQNQFAQREQYAADQLAGLGQQARADINRSYREAGQNSIQNLRDRGLGASSLVAGAHVASERGRAEALNRLSDQLAMDRINTMSGLSGQRLGALQQGNANMANADISLTNALQGLDTQMQQALFQNYAGQNANQLGLDQQTVANIVNLMAQRNDIPPSSNALLNMAQVMGQNSAPAPQQPSTAQTIMPAAIGAGGTVLAAKLIVMVCIDGDSIVSTPDGPRALREIQIGDFVNDCYGNISEVADKDFGKAPAERVDDFVEIETEALTRIRLTKDHTLQGKRADEYQIGDPIRTVLGTVPVRFVRKIRAVPCGDLRLKNGHGYIANGFLVDSMFDKLED